MVTNSPCYDHRHYKFAGVKLLELHVAYQNSFFSRFSIYLTSIFRPKGNKSRQRRRRTAFTDEQLDRLEESFENERFPGIQIREDLARELNIGEDRIQVRLSVLN